MKIYYLILLWCMTIGLVGQPYVYAPANALQVFNATELINIGKSHGIHELEKKIEPIDLVDLNISYAPVLVDIEFKTGFLGKLQDNNKVYTYETPKTTMELADKFDDKKAGAKLFDYYCKLPKFIKSDTIYYIYNNLDDYLKLLVKFKSPRLIERLKKDYDEWSLLAKKAPKKVYQTFEEMRKTSFEESLKFKPSDLYVDCNFIGLQIAGALNSLNVNGFDDSLIEKLKTKQSWPYAYRYSFPKTFNFGTNSSIISPKLLENTTGISNFGTDIKKVFELLVKNREIDSDSEIYQVIEDGSKAHVSVSRSNGSDVFILEITETNKIRIDLISSIVE